MVKSLLCASLFFLCSFAQADEQYPKDVTQFLKDAESCQHLAGEWDSDLPKEKKKDIEQQANIMCGKAKVQQDTLRSRYNTEKKILDALNDFEFY